MVSQEEWKRAIENGSEAMLQALNTFGPSETLNLLVCFSNNDPVVNQLLLKYPSVVAAGEFLSRMLVCKNRNNKAKGKIKVKRVNDGKRKAKNEESFTPEGVVKALNEPQDSLHLSSEENSRLLNVNVKENHEK